MKPFEMKPRTKVGLCAASTTLLCIGGGIAWFMVQHQQVVARDLASRYTSDGYGGYTSHSRTKSPLLNAEARATATTLYTTPLFASANKPLDLIVPVRMAYEKGDYKQAETSAGHVVEAAHALPKTDPKRPAALKVAARARYLQAFASARRHDMKQAREHFAQLRVEASALPDKGKVMVAPSKIGAEPEPTLLESAVYQHAVCTSALGDKDGAEREYMAFMKTYPDSPLVQASIKRIARFHGGDIPKEAEAVWQSAMKTAQGHSKEKQKQQSLCAPQCLAELLKRQGKAASVSDLTREMKTSDQGTSLADLLQAAKKHGFGKAQGVALSEAGLKKQKLPLVALVAPGHFVVVEQINADGAVRVWNPSGVEGAVGNVTAAAATFTYPAAQWKQMWQGSALILQ